MRVLFSTTAGAGHFAPLIPFARACLAHGHEVRVTAPGSFAATVTGAGLEHAPFDDAHPGELGAVFSQLHLGTVHEANTRVLREVFGRIDATAALPQLRQTVGTWRPDVIVSEPAEFGSLLVAEEFDLPQVVVNIGLDAFTDHVLDEADEPLRQLGCPGGTDRLRAADRLSLLPARFDEAGTATVHRFRDTSASTTEPNLPAWWPDEYADQPLVYVTFGSVAGGMGFYPAFYQRALAALAQAPVRVLMTLGAGLDPAALGNLAPHVHVESWWPQESVLGEAAAVVGHGGFGTLMATLAAGIPQVIVPLFSADQYANAERVASAGVGISLSPGDPVVLRSAELVPGGPEVSGLADAVQRALSDPAIAGSSRAIAADVAALPPATGAVDVLLRQAGL